MCIAVCHTWQLGNPMAMKVKMSMSSSKWLGAASIVASLSTPVIAHAKDPLPSLDRCFAAVRKELDPKEGESLIRIEKDIKNEDWEDLKLFTREYDAGFRGGVLKTAWKQLGDNKQEGIRLSNSFTFDLIGMNQAARKGDIEGVQTMFKAVKQDLVDFEALDPSKGK
jgi:hypothetical protein